MQGDVFCFSNLDEALFETDFVIEAINEELEDKKHLLEREYNFFSIFSKLVTNFNMFSQKKSCLPIQYTFFCHRCVKNMQAKCYYCKQFIKTFIG